MAQRAELVDAIAALERTALAWERTGMGLAALGALLVKLPRLGAPAQAGGIALIAAAVLMVLVVVPVGYHRTRQRVEASDRTGRPIADDPWRARTIAATATLMALVTLAVALDVVVVLGQG